MNIYSHFIKKWQHLKEFFQESLIEKNKNLSDPEESREIYKSENSKQSQLSSAKGEEGFNSRALRLIFKNLFKIFLKEYKVYFQQSIGDNLDSFLSKQYQSQTI